MGKRNSVSTPERRTKTQIRRASASASELPVLLSRSPSKLSSARQWGDREGKSEGVLNWGRETVLPLLMVPLFSTLGLVLAVWLVECSSDTAEFWRFVMKPAQQELFGDFSQTPYGRASYNLTVGIWRHCYSQVVLRDVQVVLGFAVIELILMRVVPGSIWTGPITSSGHKPTYKANGMWCHVLTVSGFLAAGYYGVLDIASLYVRFVPLAAVLNTLGMTLAFLCIIKGLYYPSTRDSGHTGSWALNYYWGTELYPRVLGWDVKQFTNCRFGMMSWSLICISCMFAQRQIHGYIANTMVVSVALQVVYCTKFFYWETGYFNSIDIHMDRAGFYLLWGCACWVPIFYTSGTNALTSNPVQLPMPVAVLLFMFGCCCIFLNYWADEQRCSFRKSGGKEKIWGKIPEKIEATYITSDGNIRDSLLLCSGFWGLSRHFHYCPEILAAASWCVPLLGASPVQYGYVLFLIILLLDRSYRDDDRCHKKYGKYWDMYCEKVPYKIIPYVF